MACGGQALVIGSPRTFESLEGPVRLGSGTRPNNWTFSFKWTPSALAWHSCSTSSYQLSSLFTESLGKVWPLVQAAQAHSEPLCSPWGSSLGSPWGARSLPLKKETVCTDWEGQGLLCGRRGGECSRKSTGLGERARLPSSPFH